MIVFGSGERHSVLGDAGTHPCPECGEEAPFRAVCNYSFFHLWWLFRVVRHREYAIVCTACGAATPVDRNTIRQGFRSDNIPFLNRYGGLLLLLVIGCFFARGVMAENEKRSRNAARLAAVVAAPRGGDIFLANLYYVPNSGFNQNSSNSKSGKAWGALRVVAVEDDEVQCITSTIAFKEYQGLAEAMRKRSITFDENDILSLTHEDIKAFLDQRVILDARR
ncbi:MAG: hypothetical protein LIP77_03510 [Planctomycetes bacterium]|nr:hypothetical protein [Planctomycetota bacterium]